jgi:hypothetical protein
MPKKKAMRKRKITDGKRAAPKRRKRAAVERLAPKDWRALEITTVEPMGLGPNAAGQSGDIEGLSTVATGNSESVAELVEEGQDLEAEKVSGVENAPDPDQAEVRTHHFRR